MLVVEGTWAPWASPSLNILIFKMGIKILVLQSCQKSWPTVGPAINYDFASHPVPTFHSEDKSWFKRLAYLRNWYPYRYLAGTKDPMFYKIHSVSYPDSIYLVIICSLLPVSMLQSPPPPPLHRAKLPSHRKRLRNAVYRIQIILWECNVEKSPAAWNQSGHSSDSLWIKDGFLAVSHVSKSKQLVSPLFHLGHPINFKLQNTLWVGKGKRRLPNILDFLPLWAPAGPIADAGLCASGGRRTQELKAMALYLFRQTCLQLSFTIQKYVVWSIFIYLSTS